jgi:hypothetical protein
MEDFYLNQAYDESFEALPSTKYGKDLDNYRHMSDEKVTTNLDARNAFLETKAPGKKLTVDEQNKLIEDAPIYEIYEALRNSGKYGEIYSNYLSDNFEKALPKIEKIKDAMKYVGIFRIPMLGVNNK